MTELAMLIIEDEPEVRDAIIRDLEPLRSTVRIEAAEDIRDARSALEEIRADGDTLALVVADHRLPGMTGIEFLIELNQEPETAAVRKVLLTGQADLADTISAVNGADLDHYIAKPWQPEQLQTVCRMQLTDFVINNRIDPLPFVRDLDGPRLLEHYAKRASDR